MEVNYNNKFKIKVFSFNDIETLLYLYGGVIQSDAHLWVKEFWYYTNNKKDELQKSSLIEILE
jgi:hypothetical protein